MKWEPAIHISEDKMKDNWNSFCEIDEPALLLAIKEFMEAKKDGFDYSKHRLRVRLIPGQLDIIDKAGNPK